MAARKLLITGATGKQGGAVIDALLARSSPFEILALSRNKTSPAAQALASKPHVTVVQGDSMNPEPIFTSHGPIYGVFCITAVDFSKENEEEAQGMALIDAALKHGVEHFVFTSVDRGGPQVSDTTPTYIPHFISKHNIELYLKKRLSETGDKMQWTILRPTAFMDNFTPDFQGKSFPCDVEWFGRQAIAAYFMSRYWCLRSKSFLEPESYRGRAISLAGDELTLVQGRKVFMDTMGYKMPETFAFIGSGIMMMVKELRTMFKWFKEVGYGADIPALRREEPQLQGFGTWLKESSKFQKK